MEYMQNFRPLNLHLSLSCAPKLSSIFAIEWKPNITAKSNGAKPSSLQLQNKGNKINWHKCNIDG